MECIVDDHCPSMLGGDQNYCESYRCVECRDDVQCADGLACGRNICVERASNVTCAAPNRYEIGQVVLELAGHVGSYDGSCVGAGDGSRPETVFELVRRLLKPPASAWNSDFDTLMYARRAPSTCTDVEDNCESFCNDDDASTEVACNDDAVKLPVGFAQLSRLIWSQESITLFLLTNRNQSERAILHLNWQVVWAAASVPPGVMTLEIALRVLSASKIFVPCAVMRKRLAWID